MNACFSCSIIIENIQVFVAVADDTFTLVYYGCDDDDDGVLKYYITYF